MVPEGVGDASEAPAVGLVGDRPDDGGSGGNGTVEDSVGIVDGEDEADGGSVKRRGAEVVVRGGFVGEPEFCSVDGEMRDDGAAFGRGLHEDGGSEGGLIEGDGSGSVADIEEWGEKSSH